eukprot:3026597-Rhodomonas_salina.2
MSVAEVERGWRSVRGRVSGSRRSCVWRWGGLNLGLREMSGTGRVRRYAAMEVRASARRRRKAAAAVAWRAVRCLVVSRASCVLWEEVCLRVGALGRVGGSLRPGPARAVRCCGNHRRDGWCVR